MCLKKGCLGRCRNPECGLLMHQACAPPLVAGGDQQCPICKVETQLGAPADLPYWHEAEVGAPAKRCKPQRLPESRPPFPTLRWPTLEEARFHGYSTLKEWYVDYRQGDRKQMASEAQLNQYEIEFRGAELILACLT